MFLLSRENWKQWGQVLKYQFFPLFPPLFSSHFPPNYTKMQLIFLPVAAERVGAAVIVTLSCIKNSLGQKFSLPVHKLRKSTTSLTSLRSCLFLDYRLSFNSLFKCILTAQPSFSLYERSKDKTKGLYGVSVVTPVLVLRTTRKSSFPSAL